MADKLTINGWTLEKSTETYRIFPKGKNGEAIPVTKVNNFLTLRNAAKGVEVTFKRYLHMKQWYFRCSLDKEPIHELDVRDTVARILFPFPGKLDGEGRKAGDREKAVDVLLWWVAGVPLAS
jgi:hypothetical protein